MSIGSEWVCNIDQIIANKDENIFFETQQNQLKGLEDFSANPVTLRGNILRMR